MSLTTWTRAALSSETVALAGGGWRLVESQHRVSTLKLVDTLEEQNLLERLIDGTKPPLPAAAADLHYLLATPFRYGAEYPAGSRFRRTGRTPGVFYAAERPETAVAEIAFYRLLFFAESPDTPWPANPTDYTAFRVDYACPRGLDLTAPPLDADAAVWTHPTDYGPCQDLADEARAAGVEIIRYESVRDPRRKAALAILEVSAFRKPAPTAFQTWRIYLRANGAQALCEFPVVRLEFDRTVFAADPRIAEMRWER